MKYIDSEKLIAEIERLQEFNNSISNNAINSNMRNFYDGEKDCCKQLLSFIDSLQQEQPEQKKNCNDCPHCVDRKDQYGWHFKGCFGGPYNGKFIAEIDECPLKQEQPSLPDNLDEAADEFCDNVFNEGSCTCLGMADAFKAGAEWCKDALLEWAKENMDSLGRLSYGESIDKLNSI